MSRAIKDHDIATKAQYDNELNEFIELIDNDIDIKLGEIFSNLHDYLIDAKNHLKEILGLTKTKETEMDINCDKVDNSEA